MKVWPIVAVAAGAAVGATALLIEDKPQYSARVVYQGLDPGDVEVRCIGPKGGSYQRLTGHAKTMRPGEVWVIELYEPAVCHVMAGRAKVE
jgi:hypothetical protein